MRYREFRPAPPLARHVECYWSVRWRLAEGTRSRERVLPDGCMDVLFDLGERPSAATGGLRATVVGPMTRALPVDYSGHVELVGVRFRPGGITPFVTTRASELTDATARLDELWGPHAHRLADELAEATGRERVTVLDRALLRRLRRSRQGADERVLWASERLTACGGRVPIDRLADEVGLGRRQLERRFLACVGLSPKAASRIARFRGLVARMHDRPKADLPALALGAGYADQAHMTRDFRALAGTTPGAYRKRLLA